MAIFFIAFWYFLSKGNLGEGSKDLEKKNQPSTSSLLQVQEKHETSSNPWLDYHKSTHYSQAGGKMCSHVRKDEKTHIYFCVYCPIPYAQMKKKIADI